LLGRTPSTRREERGDSFFSPSLRHPQECVFSMIFRANIIQEFQIDSITKKACKIRPRLSIKLLKQSSRKAWTAASSTIYPEKANRST
jgi:hypothetical protein